MIPRGYPQVPVRAKRRLAPLLLVGLVLWWAHDQGLIEVAAAAPATAAKHRAHSTPHRSQRKATPPPAPAAAPLGPAQGDVVKLAMAQARRMQASPKVTLALVEAGLVESNLRNIPYGDRDSLGFLQQRPSCGWRCPMNITCATWDFLRRAIPLERQYSTSGRLAQAVQRSAFPERYDQREAQARRIIRSYLGRG